MVEAATHYVDPKQYSITTSNTYAELVCITKDAMYTYMLYSAYSGQLKNLSLHLFFFIVAYPWRDCCI